MAACKRASESADVCVFCESESNESGQSLSSPSETGRGKIFKLLPKLRKNKCRRQLSDRLSVLEEQPSEFKYHKNCYRVFVRENDATPPDRVENPRPCREPVDWTSCIFCQDGKKRADLHVISSLHMAQQIHHGCETHPFMSQRVPPYLDIIASGIKYHNRCYVSFLRESWKAGLKLGASNPLLSSDDTLQVLADELLSQDTDWELSLDSAFQRYVGICEELGVKVPSSYVSRKQTFLSALKLKLGDTYDVNAVKRLGTVLTPARHAQTMPKSERDHGDISKDLSRLAAQIREEISNTPSHVGFHGDEESAVACVPAILLDFIRQVVGSDSGDGDGSIAGRQALSIAQDVVYCVSKGRKWTPKHVGLANTIHQETRSKRLVQMLHNAGHCISYKQLLTVTTGLAEAVLNSADEVTGATVPPNLVPGKFVHFAVDNIDILDESLDGKDTFHATQVRCQL